MPVWEKYQAALAKAIEDMRQEKRKASYIRYPATDKAFGVNTELLTTQQATLFNFLNDVLIKLDISPQEFDQHFRREVLLSLVMTVIKPRGLSVSEENILSSPSMAVLSNEVAYRTAIRFIVFDQLLGTLSAPDNFPYQFDGSFVANTLIRQAQALLPGILSVPMNSISASIQNNALTGSNPPILRNYLGDNYNGNPADQSVCLPGELILQKYSSAEMDFRRQLEAPNLLSGDDVNGLQEYATKVFVLSLQKTIGKIAGPKNIPPQIGLPLMDKTQLDSMVSAFVARPSVPAPDKVGQETPLMSSPSNDNSTSIARYSATDRAFGVNTELLTPPQIELFKYLNETLTKLQVTPQQFDQQFRREFMLIDILIDHYGQTAVEDSLCANKPLLGPLKKQSNKETSNFEILDPFWGTNSAPSSFPFPNHIKAEYDSAVSLLLERERKNRDEAVGGSSFATNDIVLQKYSSAEISLSQKFQDRGWFVIYDSMRKNTPLSFLENTLSEAFAFTIAHIAQDKEIQLRETHLQRLNTLMQLVINAVAIQPTEVNAKELWEQEMTRKEAFLVKRIEREATRIREEERIARIRAEEGKQPKPYPLPLTPGKHAERAKQDFGPLCDALDCREKANKDLGQILLASGIIEIVAASYDGRMNELNRLFKPDKNPKGIAAIKHAYESAETILAADSSSPIAKAVTSSALLMAILTGNSSHVEALGNASDPSLYLKENILPELFPNWFKRATGSLDQEDLALLEKLTRPEPKILEPKIPEIIKKEDELPPPPIAAPVITPEPLPKPKPPIEVIPPAPPIKKIPELFRSNIYTSTPRLSNEELWALLESRLADAEMNALKYADFTPPLDQYYCELDIRKDPYELRHIFARIDQDRKGRSVIAKEEWKQSLGTNNLDDAVDMKIAIQAAILNDDFFSPLRRGKFNAGKIGILDTETIPVIAPEVIHISRSAGACFISFDARDHKNGPLLHFSMPLGVIDRPHTLAEVERRRDVVIQEIDRTRASRVYLTKDTLMEHLKKDVIKNSPDNSLDWYVPKRLDLPYYEKPTLISNNHGQRVALGAVTLRYDASIDAPTWIADFRFHLQTEPENKDLGPVVRTHSLRIHSNNEDLAIERATFAAKQLHEMIKGQHSQGAWSVEGDEKKDLVQYDEVRLERIFQEIRRYEDDVGCQLHGQTEIGNDIEFTVKAMRCWGVYMAKKDASVLEPIDIAKTTKVGSEAEPVEMVFRVPKTNADFIQKYANQVHNTFSIKLGEAYASIALSNEGEHKPKTPERYFRITAPEVFIDVCFNHISMFSKFDIVRYPERCKDLLNALSTAQGGSAGIKDVGNEHSKRRDQSEGIT